MENQVEQNRGAERRRAIVNCTTLGVVDQAPTERLVELYDATVANETLATRIAELERTNPPGNGMTYRIFDIEDIDVDQIVEFRDTYGQRHPAIVQQNDLRSIFEYVIDLHADGRWGAMRVDPRNVTRVFRTAVLSRPVTCSFCGDLDAGRTFFITDANLDRPGPARSLIAPAAPFALHVACASGQHTVEIQHDADFTLDLSSGWPHTPREYARLLPEPPAQSLN